MPLIKIDKEALAFLEARSSFYLVLTFLCSLTGFNAGFLAPMSLSTRVTVLVMTLAYLACAGLVVLVLAIRMTSLDDAPDLSGYAKLAVAGFAVLALATGLAWYLDPPKPKYLAGFIMASISGFAIASFGLFWLAQVVRRRFIRSD